MPIFAEQNDADFVVGRARDIAKGKRPRTTVGERNPDLGRPDMDGLREDRARQNRMLGERRRERRFSDALGKLPKSGMMTGPAPGFGRLGTPDLAAPGGPPDQFALLPPSPEGEAMARQSAQMFERLAANLARGDEVAAARRFVEDLNGPGAWERRSRAVQQGMLDNIRTGPACAKRPQFTAAEIASLPMPVLPVTGAESPARYPLMLAQMRRLNARVEDVVTIADAAHAMHREQPAAFNAAVAAFIAAH